MARDDRQTNVRLPDELKTWLLEKAGENRRSLTSEVIVRLESTRKTENLESTKGEAPVIGPTEASMKDPSDKTEGHSHDRE